MLSILIPARNEKYLQQTIEDVKEHAKGEIEVLTEEDSGIGQRALINKLAGRAKGEYLMKLDAHCSLSNGFDVKLLEAMDDKTIMAPTMLPLDAERWTISPPARNMFCFDTDLVVQLDLKNDSDEMLIETMCLHGSAWVVAKKTFFDWNLCDETLGSWGHQGTELGIKAYLNGGRCITNRNAYYGHLFRTKEEDFPYERSKEDIRKVHDVFVKKFRNGKIKGLVEKFNYPADWSKEKVVELCK